VRVAAVEIQLGLAQDLDLHPEVVDLFSGSGAQMDVAGDGLLVREHGERLQVSAVALHGRHALGLAQRRGSGPRSPRARARRRT
jgi:hypothetical protein